MKIENVILMAVFATIILSCTMTLGYHAVKNHTINTLQISAGRIDEALAEYARHYQGVSIDSVNVDDTKPEVFYNTTELYPKNITELAVLRDQYGYIPRTVIFKGVDVTNEKYGVFDYTTNYDESTGLMTYHLTVSLPPDGSEVYVSRGSDK